jgi:protein TonB
MFDDFRPETMSREERTRMGSSAAAAGLIYAGVAALVLGGTAAGHAVVENLTQVEFVARAPEPPPPPPPPVPTVAPEANARPKAKRKELKPPNEVPKEKPKESNEALSAEESGPVDGFLNGVEGGTGTAVATKAAPPAPPPPPKPEPLTPPVAAGSNAAPEYSSAARRKEIEGVIVFSFDVLENGTVANVRIVSGPEELRPNVLKTVATWRFTPAKRGGKPVRQTLTKSIKFRLDD